MRCSTGSRSSSRRCATPRRRTQADARTGNVEFAQPARAPAVGEPMLLDGKRLLITGVLTDDSIAYAVAERAQRAGAEVVLTGFGRGLRITDRVARRLPEPPDVLE